MIDWADAGLFWFSHDPSLCGRVSPDFTTTMSLWLKWNNLPVKARYYIGVSTFVFALIGDYVTSRINEEVVTRKEILDEMKES